VVIRTGYATEKGRLIRSILYPKDVSFKFYSDAIKFTFFLAFLAAIGMTYCAWLFSSRGVSLPKHVKII